jgi:FkbM family methyltransferase
MEATATSAHGRAYPYEPNLVFDIGAHQGHDTAYYLHLGYRVVAVEADPVVAAECSTRFTREIAEGRVQVINVGVLAEPGEFIFYRNLTCPGLSSFKPKLGKRGGKWEELRIRCVTTSQLMQEHGIPYFMKVDIEGADMQTLLTVTTDLTPPYVSLELNDTDPIVQRLTDLGYSAFKFVNGSTFRPTLPIFNHQVGWRSLRKLGRIAPFIRRGISSLPQRLRPFDEYDPPGKYSPDGYPFESVSSGPFGENAAGRWLSSAAALRWSNKLIDNYRGAGHEVWWDVHARHGSYKPRQSTRHTP